MIIADMIVLSHTLNVILEHHAHTMITLGKATDEFPYLFLLYTLLFATVFLFGKEREELGRWRVRVGRGD
jgi:hypothetical protein